MRKLLLGAAALLAPLLLPSPAAACINPPVPVFPGARQLSGPQSLDVGGSTSAGRTTWATTARPLDVMMYYFVNLPGDGWTADSQMPGQYADQFQGSDNAGGVVSLGAVEFSRARGAERIRIVAEPIGYSVWLSCR